MLANFWSTSCSLNCSVTSQDPPEADALWPCTVSGGPYAADRCSFACQGHTCDDHVCCLVLAEQFHLQYASSNHTNRPHRALKTSYAKQNWLRIPVNNISVGALSVSSSVTIYDDVTKKLHSRLPDAASCSSFDMTAETLCNKRLLESSL